MRRLAVFEFLCFFEHINISVRRSDCCINARTHGNI